MNSYLQLGLENVVNNLPINKLDHSISMEDATDNYHNAMYVLEFEATGEFEEQCHITNTACSMLSAAYSNEDAFTEVINLIGESQFNGCESVVLGMAESIDNFDAEMIGRTTPPTDAAKKAAEDMKAAVKADAGDGGKKTVTSKIKDALKNAKDTVKSKAADAQKGGKEAFGKAKETLKSVANNPKAHLPKLTKTHGIIAAGFAATAALAVVGKKYYDKAKAKAFNAEDVSDEQFAKACNCMSKADYNSNFKAAKALAAKLGKLNYNDGAALAKMNAESFFGGMGSVSDMVLGNGKVKMELSKQGRVEAGYAVGDRPKLRDQINELTEAAASLSGKKAPSDSKAIASSVGAGEIDGLDNLEKNVRIIRNAFVTFNKVSKALMSSAYNVVAV